MLPGVPMFHSLTDPLLVVLQIVVKRYFLAHS
jgi:hypothetical protein